MPHLILEFSDNILEKNNITPLFQQCHAILTATLPTPIENCKSRAVEHTCYYLGNGQPKNAFIHVSLQILPGRSAETLQNTGNQLIVLFKNYFAESREKLNL